MVGVLGDGGEVPVAVPVYWWRSRHGGFNLGDELTPILLKAIFGVESDLKPLGGARLVGAGSVLGWAWSLPGAADNTRTAPLSVVGAGLMKPQTGLTPLDSLTVHSVRGFLTKSLLPPEMVVGSSLGDPGLLVSLLPHERRAPAHRIGVIPHVGSIGRPKFAERLAALPDHEIIDFRTDDLAGTVRQMLDCGTILSQSLHGLVIADSLRIPNAWLNFGDLHPGGAFKFYDYFSSVGRPFELAVGPGDDLTEASAEANLFEIPDRVLRRRQSEIAEAFGAALAAAGSA